MNEPKESPEEATETRNSPITTDLLPQYEYAGPQLDERLMKRAVSGIVGRLVVVLIVVVGIPAAFYIVPALQAHKSMIGKLDREMEQPFRGLIQLRVLSIERTDEQEVFFFDTSPKEGRRFIVVEVEITNRSNETYRVNPNIFSLRGEESQYLPAGISRMVENSLDAGSLESGETRVGRLVFETPRGERLRSLVIRDMKGPVAEVGL